MVFCGVYPDRRRRLRPPARRPGEAAAQRLGLHLRAGDLQALGFGFRCGFLGLLHMEIVQERLEREYNLDLITTAPASSTGSPTTEGEVQEIDNPSQPARRCRRIERIEEPFVTCHIHRPEPMHVGNIMKLCQDRRGVQRDIEYLGHPSACRSPTRCRWPR